MTDKNFMRVEDVARELDVSKETLIKSSHYAANMV